MRRTFFFALFFPPALMNLMLVAARPENLTSYFVAGYVMAAIPAVLIALVDHTFERRRLPLRAALCGLAGGVLSLLPFWLAALAHGAFPTLWLSLQIAACGAVAALICVPLFARMSKQPQAAASPVPA